MGPNFWKKSFKSTSVQSYGIFVIYSLDVFIILLITSIESEANWDSSWLASMPSANVVVFWISDCSSLFFNSCAALFGISSSLLSVLRSLLIHLSSFNFCSSKIDLA
eukprot:NODE_25_length_35605_cov_0.353461.p20 type:complete len:107 gc:universal NODE_25_length_35605_cov_0.353461:5244-5564(+)